LGGLSLVGIFIIIWLWVVFKALRVLGRGLQKVVRRPPQRAPDTSRRRSQPADTDTRDDRPDDASGLPGDSLLLWDVMRLWFHTSVGSPQGQQILGGMQQSGYTLTEALVEMLDIGFDSSFCKSVQDAAQVQGFESTWASYRGKEREVFLEQTLSYLQVRVALGEYPEGTAEQVVARLTSLWA
jgi:hypothetical protein